MCTGYRSAITHICLQTEGLGQWPATSKPQILDGYYLGLKWSCLSSAVYLLPCVWPGAGFFTLLLHPREDGMNQVEGDVKGPFRGECRSSTGLLFGQHHKGQKVPARLHGHWHLSSRSSQLYLCIIYRNTHCNGYVYCYLVENGNVPLKLTLGFLTSLSRDEE